MGDVVDKIWNCTSCGVYNSGSNESCGNCNKTRI